MKIVSKTKVEGKFTVYDITVPATHNFALSNGIVVHNCCGHDLQRLLQEGFNGIPGRVNSSAPHHLREALGQMANFLLILQGEWAGAQAFSSFDTLLAPYLFRDQLSYEDTKRAIRNFVYNLNVPSRLGQVCFTNITLDWTVPVPMQENFPLSEDKHLFEGVEDPVLEPSARERGAEDRARSRNITPRQPRPGGRPTGETEFFPSHACPL